MSILKANRIENLTTADGGINVNNSGNVGINTASPFDKLHVKAATDCNYSFSNAGGTEASLEILNDAGTSNTPLNIRASVHKFKVQSTEKCRITSDGLTFNGDTAATNALSDYEEGSWTPTAASGAGGFTVTAANCIYTKVGDLVTLHFEVYNPTSVTSSAFKIGGLPYQIASNVQVIGSVMVQNVDFPTNRTMVTMYGFSNEFRLYGLGDTQSWDLLNGNEITTSGFIIGTISYRVA